MQVPLPFRLGIQQRVFPAYRAPFFDALARACTCGLSVFAGDPMDSEAIGQPGTLRAAQLVAAHNLYLGWGPFLLVWQRGLLDWLEHWNPDVLIMDTNPRNISTITAVRWMHTRGRPVIGWGLGAPRPHGPTPRLFSASRRAFLRSFDALIAYSRTGAEQFAASGFPAERIFLAPNAATPRPSAPPPDKPAAYQDGRPVVLFVGRLQERKRVDALLRACAQLPEDIRPRVLIVGDGPARDAFQAAARTHYPSAEFLGARHAEALEPYYAAADLFVLPGTGGLAVQQAMRYGLPVIVAEADGTQADLVRGENGWTLPPNDDEALQSALAAALSDPARLRQMGRASYNIVAQEVNLERMVQVFAQAVDAVTARPQARGQRLE